MKRTTGPTGSNNSLSNRPLDKGLTLTIKSPIPSTSSSSTPLSASSSRRSFVDLDDDNILNAGPKSYNSAYSPNCTTKGTPLDANFIQNTSISSSTSRKSQPEYLPKSIVSILFFCWRCLHVKTNTKTEI